MLERCPHCQSLPADRDEPACAAGKAQAGAALEALAALRALSAWATDCGVTTLGALWELDPKRMPPDVAALWAALTELNPATIAETQLSSVSCSDLTRELLEALSEPRRHVFEQRVLRLDPPTLAELGTELGVSRARIGQVQDRAVAIAEEHLGDDRFAPLRWRAHALRNGLGAAAPFDAQTTIESISTCLGDVEDDIRHTAELLLLWLAGPYRLRGGWLEVVGVIGPSESDLAALADAHGLIALEAARRWLNEQGVREAFHEAWLSQFGRCRRVGEQLAVWSGSVVDKCVSLLAARGEPATAEQLIEEVGEGHSTRGARARFFEDRRLVRVSRTHWALRSWDREEYTGISDEIAQRIEEAGGRARLSDVIDALTTQFGVAAASVRVYAEAPRFVVSDGWVWVRTADEPYVVNASVAATRGVYVHGPERLSLLVPVDSEVLRGSGRPCPQVVAATLGVVPDGRRSLHWSGGALVITWPLGAAFGPSLGSVRELAGSAGAVDGDLLRLDIDCAAGTVMPRRVPRDLSGLSLVEQLALHTGLEVSVDTALARLAEALGVPAGEVRRRLTERGDSAVAALLPRLELDDDLADALGELSRSFGAAD